jgi:organic hydroperoxide reductase OsmC/OhrA
MADISQKRGKKDKQHVMSVQLNWRYDHKGIVTARDVKDSIFVSLPQQWGGTEPVWTPEHLFLASISSCFMTTFMVFAAKMQLPVVRYDADIIGQMNLVENRYEFTHVNLYPHICVASKALETKALQVIEKAGKYCIVAHSIKAPVIYHPEIKTEQQASGEEEARKTKRSFSVMEAKEIGDALGMNWTRYDIDEFRKGLSVELEHGISGGETNITNDDLQMTAKIACAHLNEIPDYYTRLEKMEEAAEAGQPV